MHGEDKRAWQVPTAGLQLAQAGSLCPENQGHGVGPALLAPSALVLN